MHYMCSWVCLTAFMMPALMQCPCLKQIHLEELWGPAASGGWRPSSAPRFEWPRTFLSSLSNLNILSSIWIIKFAFFSLSCLQLRQRRPMAICGFAVTAVWINRGARYHHSIILPSYIVLLLRSFFYCHQHLLTLISLFVYFNFLLFSPLRIFFLNLIGAAMVTIYYRNN